MLHHIQLLQFSHIYTKSGATASSSLSIIFFPEIQKLQTNISQESVQVQATNTTTTTTNNNNLKPDPIHSWKQTFPFRVSFIYLTLITRVIFRHGSDINGPCCNMTHHSNQSLQDYNYSLWGEILKMLGTPMNLVSRDTCLQSNLVPQKSHEIMISHVMYNISVQN